MSEQNAQLVSFEPGVYITINNEITGVRKLARVSDTGHSYTDLDGADAASFPISKTLAPKEAGNMLGWGLFFVDQEPEHHEAFSELCKQLIETGEGVLTYNRAAYWAFHNRDFSLANAMAAALEETAVVMQERGQGTPSIAAKLALDQRDSKPLEH